MLEKQSIAKLAVLVLIVYLFIFNVFVFNDKFTQIKSLTGESFLETNIDSEFVSVLKALRININKSNNPVDAQVFRHKIRSQEWMKKYFYAKMVID